MGEGATLPSSLKSSLGPNPQMADNQVQLLLHPVHPGADGSSVQAVAARIARAAVKATAGHTVSTSIPFRPWDNGVEMHPTYPGHVEVRR